MRRTIPVFLLLIALVVLTGCGQAAMGGTPAVTTGQTTVQASSAADALQPVLATSELVVGPNRLAFGLLSDNVPIGDASETKVHVRYYKIAGENATLVGEEDARYYGENLGPRGTFIVHPTFDTAGNWGLEVEAQRPGKPLETQRIGMKILEKGSAPAVGSPAPRTKTPTTAQVADLETISSDPSPQPRLHELSIDEVVTNGKPSLILFATPGFCETAVCGPGVDVLSRLKDTFGDAVNAVHVEVYQLPYQGKLVPAMRAWGLQSEPWLFLVDQQGVIAGRYEGGITFRELQPAVEKLVR